MKKVITPIILILIVGGIAYTLFNNKQQMALKAEEAMKVSEFIPVQAETVNKSAHKIHFTANGTFEANRELTLQSEASGKVVKIFKKKGDFVKAGQQIAKLDDELLQAELVINQLTYDQSLRDLERYENLAGSDAITKKQLEEIQNGSKSAEAQLKMIKKRIEFTNIVAPISGYINDDQIEIGTLLAPGMPIVDLVDTDPLKLRINVSEMETTQIELGDSVTVRAGVFPNREFKGKVTFVSSKGDASLRYPVEISLMGDMEGLKTGMFGYADFQYDQPETILINRKSLVSGLKNPEVYVIENGKARLKPIKIASIGQDQLVVLDGLNEGEKLITSGLINLRDGIDVSEF